jgi:hypothetical protein
LNVAPFKSFQHIPRQYARIAILAPILSIPNSNASLALGNFAGAYIAIPVLLWMGSCVFE